MFLSLQVESINGEWQAANEMESSAEEKFNGHRDTFLQEQDWVYLRDSGANAIRLTVGWWVVDRQPVPRAPAQTWPFNFNGTRYLDWAFEMAKKYKVRIFLSIHGAPGSQSGWGNTGTQSGLIEWPLEVNVNATLDFIDWICARYVQNEMFLGISLLNEPVKWGVPNEVAQKYYMDAYKIVRSYSQCLFVAIAARIGSNEWEDVIWLMTMPSYTNVMIEVHAYNVFGGIENVTNAKEEIEWVKTVRLKQIMDLQSVSCFCF
jgi:glucan 1,3-beta-glucosidase